MSRGYYGFILLLWALQALAVALVADQPLFWDNVLLTGQIPTQLWQTRLSTLFVPERMAGYSPLWGSYIAQGWLWFGRNLAVTHFLMLPILWGISFSLLRLVQAFIARRALGLSVALLFSIPVLTALSVQCGPDLALVWLYLAAVNAILYRNRGWLTLILVPLILVSPRGTWCLAPLFLIDQALLGNRLFPPRPLWALSKAMAFVPAVLAWAGWQALHYSHYGWLFNDPTGDYASLAEFTTLPEYLRQLGICAWRMLDMGQAAVFLPLTAIVFTLLRGRGEEAPHRTPLALLTFIPTLCFALFFAAFRNPVGHRYMLIPVLFGTLWLCYEWSETLRYDRFRLRALTVLAFFWTGHLWIIFYPDSWAKGWDSTLAHLQIGAAKRDMAASLEGLPPTTRANVGARYPDEDPWQDAFLDISRFKPTPYLVEENHYLLYSSASNEFEPADLDYLNRYARPAVTCTYWPVRMVLYRNVRVPDAPANP